MAVSPASEPPYRLHLRIEPDLSGLLIVNAATVLHLNPTATEHAYHFIQAESAEQAAAAISAATRSSTCAGCLEATTKSRSPTVSFMRR